MLNTPAPFPQVGSYALFDAGSETLLARIIGKDPGGLATISLPARIGASGTKTIPLAELIDGTPLTEAEEAEYKQLERDVPAAPSRSAKIKAQQQRYHELRLRSIHSVALANLMAAANVARAA